MADLDLSTIPGDALVRECMARGWDVHTVLPPSTSPRVAMRLCDRMSREEMVRRLRYSVPGAVHMIPGNLSPVATAAHVLAVAGDRPEFWARVLTDYANPEVRAMLLDLAGEFGVTADAIWEVSRA